MSLDTYTIMLEKGNKLLSKIQKKFNDDFCYYNIENSPYKYPMFPYGTYSGEVKITCVLPNDNKIIIFWNAFSKSSALVFWDVRIEIGDIQYSLDDFDLDIDGIGYYYTDSIDYKYLDDSSIMSIMSKLVPILKNRRQDTVL